MALAEKTDLQTIDLTVAAADAVKSLLEKRELDGYSLRVFVQGGGCSGFQYGMALEGTIREQDTVIEEHGVKVVIDEVSGIMISFFLLPITWSVVLTTFFLFRALDMFKTYPANKLEAMGGTEGIMMDDILAGVYTNIIMQIAVRYAGIV